MIEYANKDDVLQICVLEQENMPHPYSQNLVQDLFDNPRVKVLKIVKNNKIVAYVSAEIIIDDASINNVVVDKNYRRLGLGNQMIAFLKNELKASGVKKIFLEVASRNIPAINLYKNNRFKQIGIRKKYYGDDDAIIMQYDC